MTDNDKHIKAELECCTEDNCCNEDGETSSVITDRGGCCDVHIETSMEQDIPMPTICKSPEKIKNYSFVFKPGHFEFVSSYFPVIINEINSTGIFLQVSNLRI